MPIHQRNKKIRHWKANDKSFSWISKQVNISAERVRQICLDNEDKELTRKMILSKYKHFLKNESDYTTLLEQIAELSKQDRNEQTVICRQLMIRYLHDELNLSFFKIGLLLKRHHTSVMSLYYKSV